MKRDDIMHRLYQRLAPLAFMPTDVEKDEAKRLGYPHIKLGDVEQEIRAELSALETQIIEECAAVCDRWESFTKDERNGKNGTAAMLAADIRALKSVSHAASREEPQEKP